MWELPLFSSYLSCAVGHADASCRLIKCLLLQQELLQVSDVGDESKTKSLIESRLSVKPTPPAPDLCLHRAGWNSDSDSFRVTCSQSCVCWSALCDYVICQAQTLLSSLSENTFLLPCCAELVPRQTTAGEMIWSLLKLPKGQLSD